MCSLTPPPPPRCGRCCNCHVCFCCRSFVEDTGMDLASYIVQVTAVRQGGARKPSACVPRTSGCGFGVLTVGGEGGRLRGVSGVSDTHSSIYICIYMPAQFCYRRCLVLRYRFLVLSGNRGNQRRRGKNCVPRIGEDLHGRRDERYRFHRDRPYNRTKNRRQLTKTEPLNHVRGGCRGGRRPAL